jgi:hypothetical protein
VGMPEKSSQAPPFRLSMWGYNPPITSPTFVGFASSAGWLVAALCSSTPVVAYAQLDPASTRFLSLSL